MNDGRDVLEERIMGGSSNDVDCLGDIDLSHCAPPSGQKGPHPGSAYAFNDDLRELGGIARGHGAEPDVDRWNAVFEERR